MDRKLWIWLRLLTGLLFFQHGAEKLWGFAGGRIDHNFASLHGIAGPLETVGGALVALGILLPTSTLRFSASLHSTLVGAVAAGR